MKLIEKKNNMVTLKCETDKDYRELVESIPVNYLIECQRYLLKPALLKLKNGIITTNFDKALRKGWITDMDFI